jgi:hypothetical protein
MKTVSKQTAHVDNLNKEGAASGAQRQSQMNNGRSLSPDLPAQLLALQDSAGNQAVADLLRQDRARHDADPLEQEADRLARHPAQSSAEPSTKDAEQPESSLPPHAHTTMPGLSGGQPLPAEMQANLETQLQHDFSHVRIHTDGQAAQTAVQFNARAVTYGRDIAFAPGQYDPHSPDGQQLLAHELTHTAQQGAAAPKGAAAQTVGAVAPTSAAPAAQRGLFGDIWEGIRSAGEAVGGAITSAVDWLGDRAKDVGNFLSGAANWVGERLRDASQWVINLIKDLPARLGRLAVTLWEGLSGVVSFIPEAIEALASGGISGFADWLWEKAKRGGTWILELVSRVFDVLGGPELLEFVWHILTKARPLSGDEIAAAQEVLGPTAIRWGDVRVSQGGLLDVVFALNNNRAFVTWHTVNLPEGETMDTVVHELTHVYQYEQVGTTYLGGAIHAQATRGDDAYNYGGPDGLVEKQNNGGHFSDFNREEQAQIAQDYYRWVLHGSGTLTDEQVQAYEYFIAELRAGAV